MRYQSKLRPQEITPSSIVSSSWPLFLLVIIQLAVAVVAEDRVSQEELLVSVPDEKHKKKQSSLLLHLLIAIKVGR